MKPSGKGGRGVPRRAGKKGKRRGGAWYKTVFERCAKRKARRAEKRREKFPNERGVTA